MALFGDLRKSKGYFCYSLMSMVYVELILKRRVDWSTYPSTCNHSLRIGRNQKHIPDSFDPEAVSTKEILDQLRRKTHGVAAVGTPSRKNEITEAGGNHVVTDGVTKEPPLVDRLGDIRSVGEHAVEEVNAVQDQGGDVENVVVEVVSAFIEKDPCVPNQTPSVDNDRKSEDEGPNKPMETTSMDDSIDLTPDDPMRLFERNVKLRELLKGTQDLANYCHEVDRENGIPVVAFGMPGDNEVYGIGVCMKIGCEILARMAPDLVAMTHTFADFMPAVLNGAIGFDSIIGRIVPLLNKRVEETKLIMQLEEKDFKLVKVMKDLIDELQQFHLTGKASLNYRARMRAADAIVNPEPVVRMKDLPPIENDTETADDLFLLKYDGND